MMKADLPMTRDLVLVGGGHTHALVLRKWGMNPLAGARLTLIDPAPTAAYSGMLPGFVAGHYTREELDIDLVQLARFAGARLIMARATGLDLEARAITVEGRPPVAFDVASFDVGITSAMPALPGFAEHGVPAKPLTPFAHRWDAFRAAEGPARVAVIGGGVAGAELAMAMAHALNQRGRQAEIHLIDRSRALTEATVTGRRILVDALVRLGVTVIEDASVAEVRADAVVLEDGRRIASDFTVGAAGARPHDWQTKLALGLEGGFISVGPTLQSSDPAVFAVGDCAHLSHAPRPKAGVYAVRQAPILLENLEASLAGGVMRPYRPQSDYLKLVSLGDKTAMAEKWGRGYSGATLWRLKDRIDRKFMNKFRDLPVMGQPDLPSLYAEGMAEALGPKPMCGGCGAKVGRGALTEVLARSRGATRPDVESVAGDDAAILKFADARQVISTDHLRALTFDPYVMARIAALHALGDVWAMGASPQAATASVILPRLSDGLQRRTLAEIMDGAGEVMAEAGAAIVGGHSSVGSELTIGFTVTGLCEAPPITLEGARPGDVLILTKPLGSGVIFAAEMASAAPGGVVAACLAHMQQPQGAASRCLAGASAMTDVTGFGLAGHLSGICAASGVAAEVVLADVPLMDGALALSEAGQSSSLLPANRQGAGVIIGADGPRGDLMFDPQTAGGLLAAIPEARADEVIRQLLAEGYPAARIGRIVEGPPAVTFL
ncbi:selenide, water dikinase SelD [Ponticoccus sp. SC2-23]|uniref:selenide, water dikinase SelD n=1 Tax=Alexandriicola marinus TaxID=2081710 RepID=UPI000FD720F9|nr:selenide, water dikinase SelD [Alexandriicola marinus]MBM1219918.1 selenide, water dikinase SelD [Ponticoccus sp. SC6-9]MBM1224604.1 selenide, water dikinase SelD [Ponticoccus sp. SC6-15]MBM1228117.1 selenide, water dikinase SelD [Ponticoccus sp. SC6-38]MBM1234245.1 selenide, water dikinase SelD [Ponticoccus sp. SC6-45]MBM1238619.1 selenide, water dikinase SelD [Ponticoccus sp. SC6-49]MBM1242400.1 selenide, water dikinase SelD [Ponticoccus sp. SC2-64]MBM1247769.1 selenide, water dikinase 